MSLANAKLEIDEDIIKKNLLFTDLENDFNLVLPPASNYASPQASIIKPEPGICVKTKDGSTQSKVFINVCISDGICAPEDITSEELLALFESDNPSDFKVPMSIGQLQDVKDNSGNPSRACDIVIHPSFLEKMSENPLFKTFFMICTIEALDQKYQLALDKNCWTVLKNKKYHGTRPDEHRVRTSVPLVQPLSGVKKWKTNDFIPTKTDEKTRENCSILEEDVASKLNAPEASLITEIKTKKITKESFGSSTNPRKRIPFARKVMHLPTFRFHVLRIIVEVPDVGTSKEVAVKIGGDHIVVEGRDWFIDEFFPYEFLTSDTEVYLAKDTRRLLIFAPLDPTTYEAGATL